MGSNTRVSRTVGAVEHGGCTAANSLMRPRVALHAGVRIGSCCMSMRPRDGHMEGHRAEHAVSPCAAPCIMD
eukprot:7383853-Alexandrium_andersonii.AAC.1